MHEAFLYEIRVRGHLDPGWSQLLGLELKTCGGHTTLTGRLDQSALHGVLRRIADLGLFLDSVARVKDSTPRPAP